MNATKLTRPCADCPFRVDVEPYLRKSRAREIVQAIAKEGENFTCHRTDRERDVRKIQLCAGSMILLEKIGRPNRWMQIAERLGLGYDPQRLDMGAPVFDSPDDFIEAQPFE